MHYSLFIVICGLYIDAIVQLEQGCQEMNYVTTARVWLMHSKFSFQVFISLGFYGNFVSFSWFLSSYISYVCHHAMQSVFQKSLWAHSQQSFNSCQYVLIMLLIDVLLVNPKASWTVSLHMVATSMYVNSCCFHLFSQYMWYQYSYIFILDVAYHTFNSARGVLVK